jgi:putative membrane protein
MRACPLLAALLLLSTPAFAHDTEGILSPDDIWHAWSFEPAVVILLVVTAIWFAVGTWRSRGAACKPLRQMSYWAGSVVLGISQISPLHELGSTLFTAHMVQHELLILVAAPLLVFSRPIATFLWALPMNWRLRSGRAARQEPFQSTWNFLTAPAVAWTIHAVALWGWHIPSLYQATLGSEWIHALQHISFLGSALLFWWALMREESIRNYGVSFAYIFTTALHSSGLGALLTFAPKLFYPIYDGRTLSWGLSALEDQQLGGLIMWIPSGLVFLGIGLWLFARWLKESERRVSYGRVGSYR